MSYKSLIGWTQKSCVDCLQHEKEMVNFKIIVQAHDSLELYTYIGGMFVLHAHLYSVLYSPSL